MKQVVRTYYDNFDFDTQISKELMEHPDWSVQTMVVYPGVAGQRLLVVYNVERPVLTIPNPNLSQPDWDWTKKSPKVGDWPPGIVPTVGDPLPSVMDKSICKE